MSKVTEVDVKVGVEAYKTAAWRFDGWPVSPEGIKAALESYAIAQEPVRSIHEPLSEDELEAMMNQIHYGTAGSWFNNVRAAGNGLLAKRAGAGTKSMHEPVTNAEIDDFMRAISDPYEGNMTPREVTGIALDNFLARRAAATREQVVVTEEMRQECMRAIGWEDSGCKRAIWEAMTWLADRLNNKHAAPVDPRVEIVLSWANNTLGAQNVLDEDIASLLAKLDEVKS